MAKRADAFLATRAPLALAVLIGAAQFLHDVPDREIRSVPIDRKQLFENVSPALKNNSLFFGTNQINAIPDEPLHFGLKSDRGLPLLSVPVGQGELVVGAPPKAWRTTLVLPATGMVWSNFFPSWLPTHLYGQWYYTEDWRAIIWADSTLEADAAGRRLEVTNGVEFIECTQQGAVAPSQYLCPERPELVVKHQNRVLQIYYPNGSRNTFWNELDQADAPGRMALMEIARKVSTGGDEEGYAPVRTIIRNYVDSSGRITGTYTPERRIGRIQTWDSVPGSSGETRPVSRIILSWKDANAVTRDCQSDPAAEPQCTDGKFCYDGKCSAQRDASEGQQCYEYFCGDFISQGWASWFSTSSYNTTCRNALCNGDNSCWNNKVPCQSPTPMSDPKLSRIILPQRVDPSATRPLIYTFHYNGASLDILGQQSPDASLPSAKFLSHIEDNRVSFGAGANFVPQKPNFGNTVQFGYDKVSMTKLMLKSLSGEAGRDREAFRFEFQNFGLFQRVWGEHRNPFIVAYDSSDMTSFDHSVSIRNPFGLEVIKKVGPLVPTAVTSGQECDPTLGCNVLMGVKEQTSSDGYKSTWKYRTTAGRAQGNLEESVAIDGTKTKFTLDAIGRAQEVIKEVDSRECMKESYKFTEAEFPTTPTEMTLTSQGTFVRTEAYDICTAAKGCPTYEFGATRSTTYTYANGGSMSQSTAHAADANGAFASTTTVTARGVSAVMAKIAEREPVFGRPRTSATPGFSSNATRTPAAGATNNPTTANPTTAPPPCDASREYCGGVDASNEARGSQATEYWVAPDAKVRAALNALQMTDADPSKLPMSNNTRQTTGTQQTADSATGADVAAASSKQYALFTGNLMEETTNKNGVSVRTTNNWLQVDVPTGIGTWQKRNHPTVLTDKKVWSGESNDLVFAGGQFQRYAKPGETYDGPTHFGPRLVGHYKADETESLPDWESVDEDRTNRIPVIGCPSYTTQFIINNAGCYSDSVCPCGYCELSDDFGPGRCRYTSYVPDQTFVCRQTYLLDPKVVNDFNGGQNLHSDWWFKSQCSIPRCAGTFSTTYCDNPRTP